MYTRENKSQEAVIVLFIFFFLPGKEEMERKKKWKYLKAVLIYTGGMQVWEILNHEEYRKQKKNSGMFLLLITAYLSGFIRK